jgi:hypothetical protein
MGELTGYRSFWLVWLGCAGEKNGTSLYKIQQLWNINTNYLYHKESKLGKPLFKSMLESGYLKKVGRHLRADFAWVPKHIINIHRIEKKGWSGGVLILENWATIQKFIEGNREILFRPDNLKLLYKDLSSLNRSAHNIFNDIFLMTLTSNIASLSRKYRARVVERILYTYFSVYTDRNLLDYYHKIKTELQFPFMIRDEGEMLKALAPLLD